MVMIVGLQGNKLTAQLVGQPAIEVFAESPTRLFAKVVDATLDFTSGQSLSETMILRQDDQAIEFKRKP
jgi:hypothetical protein